ADLVIVAIGDPGLQLLTAAFALVHHDLEGMMDVVADALGAQLCFEFLGRPRLQFVHFHFLSPVSISIPSKASSMPARVSSARSGESSSRMGLVLLMWISTLRGFL